MQDLRLYKFATSLALVLAGVGCKDNPSSTVPESRERPPVETIVPRSTYVEPDREITDLGITAAIQRQLLFDRLTPAFAIGIETRDGIVELTGTVDNILARDRAARVAEAVRGVRSVSNRIHVVAEPLADVELAAHVEDALMFDAATDSYEIDVAADAGRVTLTGAVDSWAERQLAEQVSASVRGVTSIDNRLTFEQPDDRSDAEIAREIEKLLVADVLIDARGLAVTVEDGHVRLSGVLGSAIERTRARAQARTAGVTEVDVTDVEVDPRLDDPALRDDETQVRTEQQIVDAIEDGALRDPRVASFEILPVVRGATVTLMGSVDNLEAKRAAEQLARNTTGVARIVNEIEVEPAGGRTDAEIAAAIAARLLTNVHTDLDEIDVDVDGGTVTMTGIVDTYFEKAEATEIASETTGVTYVDNLLQVERADLGYYYDPYLRPYEPYVEYWNTYTPAASATSDEQLEAGITDELFWNPFIDEARIDVSVSNGEATLTGTVESWRQRDAATHNAYEAGALKVHNLVHVDL